MFLLATLVAWLGNGIAQGQAKFTPLGTFGATRSDGLDVSADGSVVVGTTFQTPPPSLRFFRWTAQGNTLGPASGGIFTGVAAVSADGEFVVGGFPSGVFPGTLAIRWNADGISALLGTLPGDTVSSASDVSANGAVVVGASFSNFAFDNPEAFRWTEAAGMVGLGGLPGAGVWSVAIGTSADGSVIVGEARDAANTAQAFRWTAQTGMVPLPLAPNGTRASARSVTPDGSIVVGTVVLPPVSSMSGRAEAFRWSQSTGMVPLGDLPGGGISSRAHDVSADGSVIVGQGQTFSAEGVPTINEAFYWTQSTGMLNLRETLIFGGATGLDGWMLAEANGVSYDGLTVVGTAIDPSGQTQAFVATVGAIPEPKTWMLAVLAALVLFAGYLRQRFAPPALGNDRCAQ